MIRTRKTFLIGALSGLLLTMPAWAGSDQPATSEGQPAAMSDDEMRQMMDEHQKEMQKIMQQHRDEMQKTKLGHDEMEKMKQSHDEMEKMMQRHREALKKALPSRGIASKPGSPQHSY
jgi:uncharacterized membrane protein